VHLANKRSSHSGSIASFERLGPKELWSNWTPARCCAACGRSLKRCWRSSCKSAQLVGYQLCMWSTGAFYDLSRSHYDTEGCWTLALVRVNWSVEYMSPTMPGAADKRTARCLATLDNIHVKASVLRLRWSRVTSGYEKRPNRAMLDGNHYYAYPAATRAHLNPPLGAPTRDHYQRADTS